MLCVELRFRDIPSRGSGVTQELVWMLMIPILRNPQTGMDEVGSWGIRRKQEIALSLSFIKSSVLASIRYIDHRL
jgi:hypothetical protein